MIHQPLVWGGWITGQASDIQIEAEEMLREKKSLTEVMAQNCGKTYEQLLKDMDRNNWMTAEEAKKYGLIDKIIK